MTLPPHRAVAALSTDPSAEIITWLQYAAQKLPSVESVYLFTKRESESESHLAAGVFLAEGCRLGDRQAVKKQLGAMVEEHGINVLGLREVIVLDDILGALVTDCGFKAYQRKHK